jgi:rhodanese-related sulfurtransferase
MKFFFLSLTAFLLQACSTSSETHIKQTELLSLLNSEQNHPIIIDVRSSAEYNTGHIPQAQHISFWKSFSTDALDNRNKKRLKPRLMRRLKQQRNIA